MNKTQEYPHPDLQAKSYLRLNELKFNANSNIPYSITSLSPTQSTISLAKNFHQDNLSSNFSSTNFSNATRAQLWMVNLLLVTSEDNFY